RYEYLRQDHRPFREHADRQGKVEERDEQNSMRPSVILRYSEESGFFDGSARYLGMTRGGTPAALTHAHTHASVANARYGSAMHLRYSSKTKWLDSHTPAAIQ